MSETVQIESFNAEFLTKQKLHDLIFYRKSFDITNVNDISETVKIGHCCKVSDEAAFCLIQRPYISKTLLTRRISPRGSP